MDFENSNPLQVTHISPHGKNVKESFFFLPLCIADILELYAKGIFKRAQMHKLLYSGLLFIGYYLNGKFTETLSHVKIGLILERRLLTEMNVAILF